MKSSANEQIVYKGIKVPAKSIDVGNNKTKLIPISTNRYALHGTPMPKGIKVSEKTQAVAKTIIDESKNTTDCDKRLLITYIRRTLNDAPRHYYFGKRGDPYGVMVAFLYNNQVKIGWSKRIEGDVFEAGRMLQKEPLVFTKKDAVYVAVLRGLTDSIILNDSGMYTTAGKIIPKSITKSLVLFNEFAQRIFKKSVSNITTVLL